MRRLSLAMALALLGCGPPSPALDDDLGGESSDDGDGSSDSSSSSDSSDSSDSGDSGDSGDSSDSGDSDTDASCPTYLSGMLEIDDQSELSAYACLEHAQWIYIEGDFTDLSFLATLSKVQVLHLGPLPKLTSLESLTSLQEVDELWLTQLPQLTDLGGLREDLVLDWLRVGPGTGLVDLATPPDGAQFVQLWDWDREDLSILSTLDPLPLRLEINDAPLVTDLGPIADCCLVVADQLNLVLVGDLGATALQGLEPFTSVDRLQLQDPHTLTALTGLQNLASVDTLLIKNDCSPFAPESPLVDLHGLESLSEVGYLDIADLDMLLSLDGLPTAGITVGGAGIYGNDLLDQALVDAWAAAAMVPATSCDNLNGDPCEGFCPQ